MQARLVDYQLEIEGASMVVVGALNPAIFHPSWFRSQGLISKPDADAASVELISSELAAMTMGGIRVIAQRDRFQVEITGIDMLGPARDLVIGTFGRLEHTPVAAMGLQHHAHYRMASTEDWHTIGHRLAPKDLWQNLIDDPGMRAVHIQGKRPGSPAQYATVQVEPSRKTQPGVYIGTNEHYAGLELVRYLECLNSEWEPYQRFARELGPKLLKRALDAS